MNIKIFKVGVMAASVALGSSSAMAAEFGLFGDVNFYKNNAPGENSAFSLGALDFYATTNITDDTQVFVEYVFEDSGSGLVTDLERLWIGKQFNDALKVAVGRFHTPVGLWNRSYHHGALLQDTVSRPFFLDFEDGAAGVLPVHIVGMLANGSVEAGSGEINYEAYVANGSSIDSSIAGLGATPGNKPELDINVASDPNGSKMIGARVTYAFADTPLVLGVMALNNVIAESAETGGLIKFGDTLVDQKIYGADLNFDGEHFLALGEYYQFDNDTRVGDGKQHTGNAYYLQLGYKFNERHRVVYRHARLDFDATDAYFQLLGARTGTHNVVAYRYDMDVTNAIKVEVNRNSPDAGSDDTTYVVQWAFMVP